MATSLAVEGMHLSAGHECLVADDPQQFAAGVVQLYTDCALWSKLVKAAHTSIERHFSVEVVGGQLLKALELVGLTACSGSACH